jgi:serine/threonine protein kinase
MPELGGHQLIERLGVGPRSEVWIAEAPSGRGVALKLVMPDVARRSRFATIFEKETSSQLAMSHPNILPCLQRGVSGSQFFVTQERARCSLRTLLRRGPVPPLVAVAIAKDICSALDYAHRRATLHRHVVAENVFVDPSPQSDGGSATPSRVGDFGWSLLNGPPPAEAPGDPRMDLYELGGLMYEAISGRPPVEPVAPLAGRIAGVTAKFDEFFARARAADPSARYGRASEMSLALSLLSPAMTEPSPSTDAREPVSFVARNGIATMKLKAGTTETAMQGALRKLEAGLRTPAAKKWAIAYDLMDLPLMEDAIKASIVRFHGANERAIARLAFCSPRSLVRASALLIAQTAKVPWKAFAAPEPMHAWLETEALS